MRSYIDEQGKVAWIFDEATHPKGREVVVESKPVLPGDLNNDGVVDKKDKSLAGKILGKKK